LAASADAVLVLQEPIAGIDKELRALQGVEGLEPARSIDGYPAFRIRGAHEADLCPAVYAAAQRHQWPVRELRRDVKTLESVFNSLVTTA
jgi:hypothetical protein